MNKPVKNTKAILSSYRAYFYPWYSYAYKYIGLALQHNLKCVIWPFKQTEITYSLNGR